MLLDGVPSQHEVAGQLVGCLVWIIRAPCSDFHNLPEQSNDGSTRALQQTQTRHILLNQNAPREAPAPMAGGVMVSYENIFIKNRHLNLISGSTKSLFLDQ